MRDFCFFVCSISYCEHAQLLFSGNVKYYLNNEPRRSVAGLAITAGKPDQGVVDGEMEVDSGTSRGGPGRPRAPAVRRASSPAISCCFAPILTLGHSAGRGRDWLLSPQGLAPSGPPESSWKTVEDEKRVENNARLKRAEMP